MQDHAVPDQDSFLVAAHAVMDAFANDSTVGSLSDVSPTVSVTHDHADPDHASF